MAAADVGGTWTGGAFDALEDALLRENRPIIAMRLFLCCQPSPPLTVYKGATMRVGRAVIWLEQPSGI